jgi:hypothetical protein
VLQLPLLHGFSLHWPGQGIGGEFKQRLAFSSFNIPLVPQKKAARTNKRPKTNCIGKIHMNNLRLSSVLLSCLDLTFGVHDISVQIGLRSNRSTNPVFWTGFTDTYTHVHQIWKILRYFWPPDLRTIYCLYRWPCHKAHLTSGQTDRHTHTRGHTDRHRKTGTYELSISDTVTSLSITYPIERHAPMKTTPNIRRIAVELSPFWY